MVDNLGLFIVLVAIVTVLIGAITAALDAYKENLELQKVLLEREILKLKAQQKAWEDMKQQQKNKPRYK